MQMNWKAVYRNGALAVLSFVAMGVGLYLLGEWYPPVRATTEEQAKKFAEEEFKEVCERHNWNPASFSLDNVNLDYSLLPSGKPAKEADWVFTYVSDSSTTRNSVRFTVNKYGGASTSYHTEPIQVFTEEQAKTVAAEQFREHCKLRDFDPASFVFRSIEWVIPSGEDSGTGKPWKEHVWIVSYANSTTQQTAQVMVSRFGLREISFD